MAQSNNSSVKKTSLIETFLTYLTNTRPVMLLWHLIWLTIASCVLSSTYILAFHFTSVISLYEEVHNIKNFQQNLKISAGKDIQLNDILVKLLETSNANRAYIFRYHNGLAAVSGVPFFFQTNTHEVISPGTSRVLPFEQRIPASINIAMNNQFMMNRCAAIAHTDEDKDSQNYWYFQNRGAKSMIRCPIFMPNGDLLGFVGLDFSSAISTDQLHKTQATLKDIATDIAKIYSLKK